MTTLLRLFHTALGLAAIGVLISPVRGGAQETIRIERPAAPTVITSQPLRVVEPDRATVSHVFKLGNAFGDRDVFDITLPRAGLVRIRVDWRGTTERLAVILNGPGQTGYYARRDGVAPLNIEFNVTDELFRRGANWRVSVVNFSRRGDSVGRMVVDYPAMLRPLARLSPTLRRIAEDAATQPPAPAGEPERSILPDGRVQVRYPDGRVVIYEPGCGYTTIFPDGTTSTAMCNQVQPASLPALPSDPTLQSFLEGHRDHLLQQISKLVDYRQDEIDLYLSYESANTDGLFQEIQMRMRLIDNLLQ
jgi:hypothetical protein